MNQFFHSTESIRIVHQVQVDAEIQRSHPAHNLRVRASGRHGLVTTVRRGVGRGLIALGTWLDPAAGRQAQGVPALQG